MLLKLKLAALSAMLIVGVGLGTYANADQTPAPVQTMPNSPGMMQGGMSGSGDMMGQMMQMMSLCNQMMQSAMQHPAVPGQPAPAPKGSGG